MTDEELMGKALFLGSQGLGLCSPNPAVGAIIERDGEILGEGWHQSSGKSHAEINAIEQAIQSGHSLAGSRLFITLEPCSTKGRTGACTERIIKEQFSEVIYACPDPQPEHSGRADSILEKAGIKVTSGLLADACSGLIKGFTSLIQRQRPWVIAKAAMTLDGRLTTPEAQEGVQEMISSEQSRADAMLLRSTCDAVLIGAKTARNDDPQLTIRGVARETRQPWRVVITMSGDLPQNLQLLSDEHKERTIIYDQHSWQEIMDDLAARGCARLLVEGGGKVFSELLQNQLIDEFIFYIAPKIAGGGVPVFDGNVFTDELQTVSLDTLSISSLGENLRITTTPIYT